MFRTRLLTTVAMLPLLASPSACMQLTLDGQRSDVLVFAAEMVDGDVIGGAQTVTVDGTPRGSVGDTIASHVRNSLMPMV